MTRNADPNAFLASMAERLKAPSITLTLAQRGVNKSAAAVVLGLLDLSWFEHAAKTARERGHLEAMTSRSSRQDARLATLSASDRSLASAPRGRAPRGTARPRTYGHATAARLQASGFGAFEWHAVAFALVSGALLLKSAEHTFGDSLFVRIGRWF